MTTWIALYRAAVLETDDEKLRDRLDEVDEAICVRLHELKEASDNDGKDEELRKIWTTIINLEIMRSERLRPVDQHTEP